MKNLLKLSLFVISFLTLSGLAAGQDNPPKSAHYNSVQINQLDAQPYPASIVYSDSAGVGYINTTLRVLDNGLFEASNGSGLDGSLLVAFKNLSPEEVDYILKFIDYRAAKKKLND